MEFRNQPPSSSLSDRQGRQREDTIINQITPMLLSLFVTNCSQLDRWKASGVCATEPPVVETIGIQVETSSAKECLITVDSR